MAHVLLARMANIFREQEVSLLQTKLKHLQSTKEVSLLQTKLKNCFLAKVKINTTVKAKLNSNNNSNKLIVDMLQKKTTKINILHYSLFGIAGD